MKRILFLLLLLGFATALNFSSRESTRAMNAYKAPASNTSLFGTSAFKVKFDSSRLQVAYGENYRMNLWTQVDKGSLGQVKWTVTAGGLPEGLSLVPTGPQSAVLTGKIKFLGQWCLSVAAETQYSDQKSEESFCLKSFQRGDMPRLAPSENFPKGSSGKLEIRLGVSSGVSS